ncbi:hypothetical protein HPP92_004564 [Vanilla planifolia]|uniref:Uncharacterized protein n=1 Tax=Vanilla planifolia TaxID=51239 RepID=A0A835VE32_VANPL|nr:hypothetical protein HPP92_004564 [Vanilla planifolia]
MALQITDFLQQWYGEFNPADEVKTLFPVRSAVISEGLNRVDRLEKFVHEVVNIDIPRFFTSSSHVSSSLAGLR